MAKVEITTPGIVKALDRFDYPRAIAEFIWNGFDAKATEVNVIYEFNQIGFISKIQVIDNGYGIQKDQLYRKFIPFFESEKELDPDVQRYSSAVHGKNGVGRLTFFKFALRAVWHTVFELEGDNYAYEISVDRDNLNTYSATDPKKTDEATGTSVTFTGIHAITAHNFEGDIYDFLIKDFGWFLELNAAKNYSLKINGEKLGYSQLIGDRDDFSISEDGTSFEVKYIRWEEFIREYSRYYFIDSQDNERYKDTTTLNNKSDHFYHSVYIKSKFFDRYLAPPKDNGLDNSQLLLFDDLKKQDIYKQLKEEIDKYLRDKRRPFLKIYSDTLIAEFEKDGAFPDFSQNEWDKFRKSELANLVKGLYQIEPKLFTGLNIEQKKTFVRFLNLIMTPLQKRLDRDCPKCTLLKKCEF